MSDFNKAIIEEFRANKGKVGGMFEGANLVLLNTVGAKSGQPRVNPVAYLPDGDRIVVIASNGGADNHPDWYFNLKANPALTVEQDTEKFEATAAEVTGQERDDLYARMVAVMPGFAEYEAKTERRIPVFALSRQR
ncbi:nitroreductase family deazaflavin-dependent oxidoreductase [Actinocrispum wychmicini]|uniref:Deazaflavin-dependent oxidoreductase (Nitroreductase family) n=1 Tax=Actinocrispum wychmicini TaxID=1213861 RepID=A0A4R2JQS1_9PSEU|nr:nitroreductase family deazaflavin-dependent oxidoreductase [Actinocrispum wychmicini]TCO59538.1 deazaflavin-dependent oxidoreductase (nitroreductase family) [Actinocrispum wychmicini]